MLTFIVQTKAGVFRKVATPKKAHVELLLNAVSFAELVFDDDDAALADLAPDGSRVRVLFDGVERLSGPVVRKFGSGPVGETTVLVEDDFRLFLNLGWPRPDAAITAQTVEYARYSGDVETVAKAAAAALSTRLGFGWTMATNTHLGSAVRAEFRFHPLTDKLIPLLNADKLKLSLSGGVVDVSEGEVFPRVITLETGLIGDYKWSLDAPTATRAVVGGEGEGVARVLRQYPDAARETGWGFIAEVFKDSRMAQGVTDLRPDADEVLAEGAPRASFSAELSENAWFRFPRYDVGDRVHIQVPQVEVVDVITKVTIDDDPSNGLVVTPTVGFADDEDTRDYREIAALSRGVRDAGRR